MSVDHTWFDGPAMQTPTWRDWVPDLAVGLAVLLIGAYDLGSRWDLIQQRGLDLQGMLVITLAFATAAGLSRRQPAVALLLVWLAGAYQLWNGTIPVLGVELAVAVVAFGTARWGRVPTVLASGVSIPAAAVVVALISTTDALGLIIDTGRTRELLDTIHRFSDTWQVGAAVLGMLALGAPWLAGLSLRFMARAQRSEVASVTAQEDAARAQHEAAQAQEIARLRDDQARLARDVHDVVGHSLAVILAQAESAQFLPDDPAKLKETMATIAGSARTSLQDVRQVLSQPSAQATRPASFEGLVEGVRRTGQDVEVDEVGTPRPLPPELDVVAYRVMQEMLTNAVKHGRRDRPIRVERHWPQDAFERDLRLEVSNTTSGPASEETQPINAVTAALDVPSGGQGLAGMRRRVESVGGRLDVRRRSGPDGPTFTTTVWVPVRA